MAEQREEGQAAGADHRQALPQVVVVVVAQLVGQHRLDLGRLQLGQQGVEEDDPLAGAEAGEVGVAVGRALRAVHHEEARQAEAAAGQQGLDAGLQGAVGQGLELVEQRRDEGGVDQHHQQVEAQPEGPHVGPPQPAHRLHQPQHEGDQRQPDDGRQHHALHRIGHEQARREAVEAEARLQPEAAVEAERQLHQPAHHAHRADEGDPVGDAARLGEAGAQVVQRLQPAAQGEGQQQRRRQQDVDHAEPHPRHRVIGGLLVGVEADRGGEGGGHCAPVGGHVGGLAPGQPQPAQQADAQGDEEQGGEVAGSHGAGREERTAGRGPWGDARSGAALRRNSPRRGRRIAPSPKIDRTKLWHRTRITSSGWTWK